MATATINLTALLSLRTCPNPFATKANSCRRVNAPSKNITFCCVAVMKALRPIGIHADQRRLALISVPF
jgi:hypothetical protein